MKKFTEAQQAYQRGIADAFAFRAEELAFALRHMAEAAIVSAISLRKLKVAKEAIDDKN